MNEVNYCFIYAEMRFFLNIFILNIGVFIMKNTQIKPYIEENKFKFTFEYEPVFVNCCPENMDKQFIKVKMWAF